MKKIYFAAFIFFFACTHYMNASYKPLYGNNSFDKEGHRGCRGLMPENTIPAYLRAIDLGVTTLEMDVVITKDLQPVMSHEPFFNHEITTKPNGDTVKESEERSLNIYHMNYAEVKTYDVGIKPHPRFPQQQKIYVTKPLLKEVIDSVEIYTKSNKHLKPVYYNIETKCMPEGDDIFHPKPAQFVDLMMKVIIAKGISERVIIQSFDLRSLQYVHEHYSNFKTSLLIDEGDTLSFAMHLKQLGFIPTIYSPDQSLVTSLLIKQCHDTGVKIIPWTIDDLETITKIKAMGVDGIITDFPELFNGKN